MAGLLPRSWELLEAGEALDSRDTFQLVRNKLSEMHLSGALSEPDNVESAFIAFENQGDPEHIRAFRHMVARTIERSQLFPQQGGIVTAPSAYLEFLNLLKWIKPRGVASVISLNYDLGLDFALYRETVTSPRYYLSDQQPAGTPILKLHGSLNWAACQTCDEVATFMLRDRKYSYEPSGRPEFRLIPFTRDLAGARCQACTSPLDSMPFIVPPLRDKAAYVSSLQSVWKEAARRLMTARYVVVIGYSLPETDRLFRDFLQTNIRKAGRPRFCICDPNATVLARFKELLPSRTPITHFEKRFEDALPYLQPYLRKNGFIGPSLSLNSSTL